LFWRRSRHSCGGLVGGKEDEDKRNQKDHSLTKKSKPKKKTKKREKKEKKNLKILEALTMIGKVLVISCSWAFLLASIRFLLASLSSTSRPFLFLFIPVPSTVSKSCPNNQHRLTYQNVSKICQIAGERSYHSFLQYFFCSFFFTINKK
jgi:hypothetical protein